MIQSQQNYQGVSIGKITFREGFSMQQLIDFLGAFISLTHKPKWNLSDTNYSLFQAVQIFPLIKQCTIRQLYISQIAPKLFIFNFTHIKFTELEAITLEGNNIMSIDALIGLQAPNLNTLWLARNKISSIKPLRKMHIPQLTYLSLRDNPIKQYDPLNQLQAPLLTDLDFGETLLLKPPEITSIHWLAKLQSNRLNQFTLQLANVKAKKKYIDVIRAKYGQSQQDFEYIYA